MLNHPLLKAIKSKFTRIRCSHINREVLEETRLFLNQRLGPNGFTNKGPRRFPTCDLGGLIEDVPHNNLLDLVTMLSQWNNQDNENDWATHHIKGHGVNMQANVFFSVPSQF